MIVPPHQANEIGYVMRAETMGIGAGSDTVILEVEHIVIL